MVVCSAGLLLSIASTFSLVFGDFQTTVLHCSALHYTSLHCTALHLTALHCNVLRYACLSPSPIPPFFFLLVLSISFSFLYLLFVAFSSFPLSFTLIRNSHFSLHNKSKREKRIGNSNQFFICSQRQGFLPSPFSRVKFMHLKQRVNFFYSEKNIIGLKGNVRQWDHQKMTGKSVCFFFFF